MISLQKGNILESDAQAIVNTVNTVGVMGKGLALQFKEAYPENYALYRKACKTNQLSVGQMFITEFSDLCGGNRLIVNFPTKTTWRKPSEYSYIEEGLKALRKEIVSRNIHSIAIPPLGSHNGGLDWQKVKPMIEEILQDLNCDVRLYEPTDAIIDKMKLERVCLTPARAMMLNVICDLVSYGEFASEFAAVKIVYFLEKFGAKDIFKINFQPALYGPYSPKVRYVLHYLNGSYLMGMADLSRHPFDEIWVLNDTFNIVKDYFALPENEPYKLICDKTKKYLQACYSNLSLELLASEDYLLANDPSLVNWRSMDDDEIIRILITKLRSWNERKQHLFADKEIFVRKIFNHIKQYS